MRTVSIGAQGFEFLRSEDCFYVDKTDVIKEWWENKDIVTLITRPRRFGKTLNMDMLNCFFSNRYVDRGDLFEGLSIWESMEYRQIQGTYPVISLSFAPLKETDTDTAITRILKIICELYRQNVYLLESDKLNRFDKQEFEDKCREIEPKMAADSLNFLSRTFPKV